MFLAPTLIGVALVSGVPLIYSLVISFQDKALDNPVTRFVGIQNYATILSDPKTWDSIWLSTVFTVVSVAASFVLGLIAAILLNGPMPGRGLLRAMLIIPWAVPAFVAALTWSWMFNDQFGIINELLKVVGFAQPPVWLDAEHAMGSLILVMTWKSFPFQMVLLLAGLQAISPEVYEAARIDGASAWQRFRLITLPLLQPISVISVLMAAINAFQFFPIPWILTAGGPAGATNVISITTYNVAFQSGQVSLGATLAMVMFLITIVAGAFYLWRYIRQVGSL